MSESLRIWRWWHSDSYTVRGNKMCVSPMYKHTPFCHWTLHPSSIVKPATFSRTAIHFSVIHMVLSAQIFDTLVLLPTSLVQEEETQPAQVAEGPDHLGH